MKSVFYNEKTTIEIYNIIYRILYLKSAEIASLFSNNGGMVMRKFRIFAAAVICALALCAAASAAGGKTVYVSGGADGDGLSRQTPCGSLQTAAKILDGAGGNIVLVGNTSVTAKTQIPAQCAPLTISSDGGSVLTLAMRLQFMPGARANDIVIDTPISVSGATFYIFGGFNNVTFTENAAVTLKNGGKLGFFGGTIAETDLSTPESDLICRHAYNIEVNNGDFAYFGGGSLRTLSAAGLGALAAPVSVTINGGHFGAGAYNYTDGNRAFEAFSLSGNSILSGGGSLTVNGGRFDCPIYMQGRYYPVANQAVKGGKLLSADKELQTAKGDISLQINGGSFAGYEIAAGQITPEYCFLLRGNFDAFVSGAADFDAPAVLDATQVKARAGEDARATLTNQNSSILPKRFDSVNGVLQSYTEPRRVLCIGDSITWGTGASNLFTDAYPARLAALMQKDGEVIFSNCGIPASGIHKSDNTCYPDTFTCNMAYENTDPDMIIFSLGINDARNAGGTNGALCAYYDDYRALIEKFALLPSVERVFITSALYMDAAKTDAVMIRATSVIRQLQKKIADEFRAQDADKFAFIDLYALTLADALADVSAYSPSAQNYTADLFSKKIVNGVASGDFLHPSTKGYIRYANLMYDAIVNGVSTADGFAMHDVYLSANGAADGAGTADDPISDLRVALSRMAGEATLHVIGENTYEAKVFTPLYMDKLAVVGEGDDAVLKWTAGLIKIGSSIVFDNITLDVGTAADLFAAFNDVTFTESAKTRGDLHLTVGYNLYTDRALTSAVDTLYDTAASASSDKDCKILLDGGRFASIYGGNRAFAGADTPVGIYSGDLVLEIGEGAALGSAKPSALCGQNYLTGSITAEISAFTEGAPLLEYAPQVSAGFEAKQNTGRISVRLGDRAAPDYTVRGDFNADGAFTLADVLTALGKLHRAENFNADVFYGKTSLCLSDVLTMLKYLGR